MSNTVPSKDSNVFNRSLGLYSATTLIIGTIIGTGIFLFVSEVSYLIQKPYLILLVWSIGGIIALAGSLCLAELAAMFPQTGGIYIYLKKNFGAFVGFQYAWTKFLIMRVGSYSIQTLAFARFTAELFNISNTKLHIPIAIGALGILCLINIFNVRYGSLTQNLLTTLKLLSLVMLVMIGLSISLGIVHINFTDIHLAFRSPHSKPILISFGLALIAIMWTFGGWDESTFVAEEIRNPEKNIPRSLIGGLSICVILYVLTNASYLKVLSPEELSASGGSTAILTMYRVFGGTGMIIINIILMISTLGAANGMILTGARIAYASGQDDKFFRWFAKLNTKTKTPIRGLVMQFVLGSLAIIILNDPFKLVIFTGFAYWLFTALIPLAVIRLRIKMPNQSRPFKVILYPYVPILFFIASLGMLYSVVKNDIFNLIQAGGIFKQATTTTMSILILLAGTVVFFIQRKSHNIKGKL